MNQDKLNEIFSCIDLVSAGIKVYLVLLKKELLSIRSGKYLMAEENKRI